jgi:CheY-like chemotaxis protein
MATILLVDDEPALRAMLAELFTDAGHTVVEAENGRAALALLPTALPQLVLSDVMMPLMGGLELCQRMKAHSATARLPVILMSAVQCATEATRVGADALLAKPFDITQLAELVQRLLSSEH